MSIADVIGVGICLSLSFFCFSFHPRGKIHTDQIQAQRTKKKTDIDPTSSFFHKKWAFTVQESFEEGYLLCLSTFFLES